MHNSIEIKHATANDIPAILDICDDARQFQREIGFCQWADGYPSEEVIAADIAASKGFLITADSNIIGYCVIDTNGDKEYDSRKDIWADKEPYAAIHRLALARNARGKGYSKPIIENILNYVAGLGIMCVKIDTGTANIPMQRLLASTGFDCLGKYTFTWGERLAYYLKIIPQ